MGSAAIRRTIACTPATPPVRSTNKQTAKKPGPVGPGFCCFRAVPLSSRKRGGPWAYAWIQTTKKEGRARFFPKHRSAVRPTGPRRLTLAPAFFHIIQLNLLSNRSVSKTPGTHGDAAHVPGVCI